MEGYTRGKPDVNFWIRQIRLGLEFRKKYAYEEKWSRWRSYYRGLWQPDILPSNLFFKMLRTMVPRIYFHDPAVSVTSQRAGLEHHLMAQMLERIDNQMIARMGMKKQIKKMVHDNFMFGTGIGKLGFGSQYQASPESLGDTVAPLVRGKEALEYNINVQPNMPWFMRSPVDSYVIEAGAIDKDHARWDAYIIRRPIEDVRNDPRLKHNKDLQPATYRLETKQKLELRNPVDSVDLYEIRDRKTGKVFIISPTLQDKSLLFEDDEFFRLGIDVSNPLIFNDDDENFWGIPDAQILEPNQLEINEVRTLRMYHRRLSVLKLLVQRGKMKQEEVDKLLNSDVAAVAFTEGDPRTAIHQLSGENIPSDLTESMMEVMQDVRETLGFSRNEFGEFKPGSHSPTATETQAVKAASEIRVDERRDLIADMLVKVINDVNPIVFNHWNQEQVIDIAGPLGIQLWVVFRPQMLKRGQYLIKVDPDSGVPETKEVRQQKAMASYQMLKENPLVDPVKLTQYFLREMNGLAFDDMMVPVMGGPGMSPENPVPMEQLPGAYQKLVGQRQAALPAPRQQAPTGGQR
jgi:hypothetical protein